MELLHYFLYSITLVLCTFHYPFIFLISLNALTSKSSWSLNFRTAIQLINIGNFLINFQQTVIIIFRLTSFGNDPGLFSAHRTLRYCETFGNIVETFSWLFLIIERLVATLLVSKYETFSRKKNLILSFIVTVVIIMLASTYTILDNVGMDFLILQVILIFAELVILSILMHSNKRKHQNRHELNLSGRFQIQENISATSFTLPMLLIKLANIFLRSSTIIYSIFFTNIPLGYDTGYITHIYNIPSAVYRAIFGIYMVYANPDYNNKSKQRNVVDVGNATQTTTNYFESLNEMWR